MGDIEVFFHFVLIVHSDYTTIKSQRPGFVAHIHTRRPDVTGSKTLGAAVVIGMACMNMCHEADSLGLATCIIGMNDQAKLEQYFNIPAGRDVRLVLAVGYAADPNVPVNKVRKSLEEVCSFNNWE